MSRSALRLPVLEPLLQRRRGRRVDLRSLRPAVVPGVRREEQRPVRTMPCGLQARGPRVTGLAKLSPTTIGEWATRIECAHSRSSDWLPPARYGDCLSEQLPLAAESIAAESRSKS